MAIEDEKGKGAEFVFVEPKETFAGPNGIIQGFEMAGTSREAMELVSEIIAEKVDGTILTEDPRTKGASEKGMGKNFSTGFGSRSPKAATYIPLRDRQTKTDD